MTSSRRSNAGRRFLLDGVDEDVRRRRAVLQDDAAGRGQPLGFIGLQRGDRIGLAPEQAAERAGVDDRLRAAIAALRIHRMRRVAQQRHAPERPALQRVAIDHRVGQDQIGVADHAPRHRASRRSSPDRSDRNLRAAPACSSRPAPRRRLLDLRDPIDELIAGGIDIVADRIDDHVACRAPIRAMLRPVREGCRRVTPRQRLMPR